MEKRGDTFVRGGLNGSFSGSKTDVLRWGLRGNVCGLKRGYECGVSWQCGGKTVSARTKILRSDRWSLRGFSGSCGCECKIGACGGTKSGSKSVKNPDTPIFWGFFRVFGGFWWSVGEKGSKWGLKRGSKKWSFFGFFRGFFGVFQGSKSDRTLCHRELDKCPDL